MTAAGKGPRTRLTHLGRRTHEHAGAVNLPPYRASTILFPTLTELESFDPTHRKVRYGRTGTPSSFAFEEAMADLEGGHAAVSFGSGLQALTTTLLALVKAGDHILVADSCYAPTRIFCRDTLGRMGVETTFYDPQIGAGIAGLIRPATTLVLVESPGSLTFEVQDFPAIAQAAKSAGCRVVADNTWAAGVYFRPLEHGADISIQACTKYVVGHADANLGVAVCRDEDTYLLVKHAAVDLGATASADELYLGLRGLRTLTLRLAQHQETGLALAQWLAGQREVRRVLHPALPGCPGHELWQRDFTGACGLFAVEFDLSLPRPALAAFVDGMALFGMGYSWGGYESLVLPSTPGSRIRTAVPWTGGTLVRFHAGLEDVEDLLQDLDVAFTHLREALTP